MNTTDRLYRITHRPIFAPVDASVRCSFNRALEKEYRRLHPRSKTKHIDYDKLPDDVYDAIYDYHIGLRHRMEGKRARIATELTERAGEFYPNLDKLDYLQVVRSVISYGEQGISHKILLVYQEALNHYGFEAHIVISNNDRYKNPFRKPVRYGTEFLLIANCTVPQCWHIYHFAVQRCIVRPYGLLGEKWREILTYDAYGEYQIRAS